MYADLILYSHPRRPFINPKLDLFAYLEIDELPNLFPAQVVDHVKLTLPETCRHMEKFPTDTWEFMLWQVEAKGYTIVRSIDEDWLYWSVLVDKLNLLSRRL